MAVKVVCSVLVVVLILGGLGFLFGTLINNAIENKHDVYSNAIQAESEDEFANAINNKQNVIAFGNMVADELVTCDGVEGEYAYIRMSHYQKVVKTRVVTYTENGKSKSRVETYYDWNFMGSKSYHGDTFEFLGYTFDYNTIDLPDRKLEDYDYNGFEQNTYFVIENNVSGTMFVEFENDQMTTKFYENQTIDDVVNASDNKAALIVFIVLWTIAAIPVCCIVGSKVYNDY